MAKQRGRKSAADLATPAREVQPYEPAPESLAPAAQRLWHDIVGSRPANFFSAGDLPLLREYCHTMAVLLPRMNKQIEEGYDPKELDARDKLVRQGAALARSLRLCVSARTRPDTASMRDSVQRPGPSPWEF